MCVQPASGRVVKVLGTGLHEEATSPASLHVIRDNLVKRLHLIHQQGSLHLKHSALSPPARPVWSVVGSQMLCCSEDCVSRILEVLVLGWLIGPGVGVSSSWCDEQLSVYSARDGCV